MGYTPQTWTDGSAGGTPVNAARLAYMEAGIAAAASAADRAVGSGVPGVVQVESFTGTDAQKMQAALDYAIAERTAGRYMPWLQLPFRTFNTGSASFILQSGHKILGAGMPFGPMNLELNGGLLTSGKWQTSCGSGASSLLQMTSSASDVMIVGVAFQGASTSQILRSTSNMYPGLLHNLTFYGCKHAVGNPSEKFLATQVVFSGHWTLLGFTDSQVWVGGSDNFFSWFVNGNSPSSVVGAGKPIIVLDSAGKTDLHYCYMTAENDWVGIRVMGGLDRKTTFFGGTLEGRGASNLATRPVLDVQGGIVHLYGTHLGYVSGSSGTVSGVVHQSGGILKMRDIVYLKGTGVAATFPVLYQTAGVARVSGDSCTSGEQLRVRWSTGVTDAMPLTVNGYDT